MYVTDFMKIGIEVWNLQTVLTSLPCGRPYLTHKTINVPFLNNYLLLFISSMLSYGIIFWGQASDWLFFYYKKESYI
jgi:hypothetical protein